MNLVKIADADAEPLDLAAAKTHLRETLVSSDNDAYITALAEAVRGECENRLQRTLIESTWLATLDAFPCGWIELPMPPLRSVDSVKYVDTAGTLQTLDEAAYLVDKQRMVGVVTSAPGTNWPATRCQPGAVQIQFKAGYGTTADTVPAPIIWWCRLALSELYERRALTGDGGRAIPREFAEGLLNPYKIRSA